MKKYILGVDLGGTKISTGIADKNGKLLFNETIMTEAAKGQKHVISRIESSIRTVVEKSGHSLSEVAKIGIGAPGPVVMEKGLILNPPNLPGWKRVPLRAILEKRFKKTVILENDANCAAVAELKFGAGKKFNNFIYVTVSTGIGGGIIIDKKIYRGATGSAGEVGYMYIDIDNNGEALHLEGLAAGPAMARRFGRSSKEIEELALEGDKKAQEEIQRTAKFIGIGFAGLVNILNPEAISVGGGVSNIGKPLFDQIQKTVKEMAIAPVQIIPAKLKHHVGLLGAIALCL